jgi:hypothetical protein
MKQFYFKVTNDHLMWTKIQAPLRKNQAAATSQGLFSINF